MSSDTPQTKQPGRIGQLRQAYAQAVKSDPKLGLILVGTFFASAIVAGGLVKLILASNWFGWVLAVIFGIAAAVMITMIVFGRRVERAMYQQMAGQPGAAGGALQMLRGSQWIVKPAVAATRNQDVVHRVIGRPGVILVGEGSSHSRVASLLATEAKKHQRIVGDDVAVTTIAVGSDEGDVALPKLVKTVRKLPKKIKPAQQTDVIYKLKALDAMRPAVPLPKGPMPTSARGARRQMRG